MFKKKKNNKNMNQEIDNELENEIARQEDREQKAQEANSAKKEKEEGETTSKSKEEENVDSNEDKEIENEAKIIEEQLTKAKDDYLRLAAEFDNYRRRVAKEKIELITTASEGVIKDLLPIVDDFERAITALSETKDSIHAKEGTELIYKKVLKLLKEKGVEEIEALDKELDTDLHEAIAMLPSPTPEKKGKIIEVTQKGYKMGDKVIRCAKVVVGA